MEESEKDIYKSESVVAMQFFCEDLFQGIYKKDRDRYIKDMFCYIHRVCDEIEKIAAQRMKKAVLGEVSEKFSGYMKEIQDELTVSRICTLVKGNEEEEIEDIFKNDEFIIDVSKNQ